MTRGTVYQAVCVPASCSHQDIETAVSQYLQKYKHPAGVQYTVSVSPVLCHTSQQKRFSYGDYTFMLVHLIMFHVVDAVQAVLLHAMKAQRGGTSRGIALPKLNPGATKGGCSAPCPGFFAPIKETQNPLHIWLSGPWDQSGWVHKISPPTRVRTPDCSTHSKLLYRLYYPGRRAG